MSNPVFDRIEKDARAGYAGFGSPRGSQGAADSRPGYPAPSGYSTPPGYPPPQYGQTSHGQMSPEQLDELYQRPAAGPVSMGRVTVEDVVMKTATLFALMLLTAAASWFMLPVAPGLAGIALLGSIVATLALGFVIALKKTISVPLIVVYALLEGVLVGTVSRLYETRWNGIVPIAIVATLSVFAGMLVGYRSGIIKVTSKSRRIASMAIMGYLIFMLVNLVVAMFGGNQGFGIFARGSMMGILISVFAVGLASYALAMDFDSIESAVRAQMPEKYSWLLAHGLIVTLVWLYLEILRLLSHFQSSD